MTKNVIIKALKDWGGHTTTHAIPNIVTTQSKIMRIIWIICFLVSLGYCLFQIVICILSYMSYGVISNYEYIYETPTLFPVVDICNINPYDGNFLAEVIAEMNNKSISSSNVTNYYYIEDLNTITVNFKTYLEKKNENDSISRWYSSFWPQQLIISCLFNNEPCYFTDFMYYHNFHYGACFSFNLGMVSNYSPINSPNDYISPYPGFHAPFSYGPVDLKYSQQPGSDYGLQLELFTGDPIDQIKYTYSKGIRVLIRNQSDEPVPEELGFNCLPGVQSNIAVSRMFIDHLSLPYNDCIDELNDENFQRNTVVYTLKTKLNKTTYNQAFCLKVCSQLFIIDKCSCWDYSLPKINNSKVQACFLNSDLICLAEKKIKLFKEFSELCNVNCPMECKSQIYDVSISSAEYPTQWYAEKLIMDNGTAFKILTQNNQLNYSKWNYDYLKKTTLKLNVYYESLVFTHVYEAPAFTIDSLISFLGGNLGLFLGMSLLTVIEAVDFIFNVIYFLYEKRKNQIKDDVLKY